jgi:hypothetical protein
LKPRGLISSGEDSLRSFDGGWGMWDGTVYMCQANVM